MNDAAPSFAEIDWANWQATQDATLLFVLRGDQVLLIRKKRGLGAGKINGPGGRVDAGETARQAAIREVEEELGITPTEVEECGQVLFQVLDGTAIRIHVFRAGGFDGTVTETDEAIPLWTPVDAIPYDEMWADDVLWMPLMLRGEPFEMRTLFDDDRLLGYELHARTVESD